MTNINAEKYSTSKIQKGRWGEQLAAAYLREHGFQIFHQNFYSKFGELDIVAKKDHLLVFVEVKTRFNQHYGTPGDAVDHKKRKRMTYAAAYFLQRFGLQHFETRFDVIEIQVEHCENV